MLVALNSILTIRVYFFDGVRNLWNENVGGTRRTKDYSKEEDNNDDMYDEDEV